MRLFFSYTQVKKSNRESRLEGIIGLWKINILENFGNQNQGKKIFWILTLLVLLTLLDPIYISYAWDPGRPYRTKLFYHQTYNFCYSFCKWIHGLVVGLSPVTWETRVNSPRCFLILQNCKTNLCSQFRPKLLKNGIFFFKKKKW